MDIVLIYLIIGCLCSLYFNARFLNKMLKEHENQKLYEISIGFCIMIVWPVMFWKMDKRRATILVERINNDE
jgi:uncharacterized membrane protein